MSVIHPHIFSVLTVADLDAVLEIEMEVYTHPWTRGNFLDSFYDGHQARGLRDASGELLGYFFLMPIIDELHLLTFAVAKKYQGQGYAKLLLQEMMRYAQLHGFASIMLEVRVSNIRAMAVYQRFGFVEIGRRKGYYPVNNLSREDAIVMRIDVTQGVV
jgi:ribosomal-protein-alanine N-acetyltransferase